REHFLALQGELATARTEIEALKAARSTKQQPSFLDAPQAPLSVREPDTLSSTGASPTPDGDAQRNTEPTLSTTERVSVPPAAPAVSDNEQRLVARAQELMAQKDVGGARLLLERAVALGNARAAFLLAQTYDPRILASWRVRGISGDTSRARELYGRARDGGVIEATNAIRRSE
ncbi:MAG TPA: hypothetical protein VKB96_09160, partial [Gammaproteobacteria bacterium]|nr:hypothetical protein [Gammaproteobacteria bacterium]